jgi:uncharacterized membrane protein YphA (DoxX/SURF4 family)
MSQNSGIRISDSFSTLQVGTLTYSKTMGMKLLGRFFFAFPAGLPGVALLLVRVVFGTSLILQGAYCLITRQPAVPSSFTGMIFVAGGALLLIGYLTPIVGIALAVGVIAVVFSFLPVCSPNVFNSLSAWIFGLTMLFTVVALGPGAFSVDARLFGRREILIPRRASSSCRPGH